MATVFAVPLVVCLWSGAVLRADSVSRGKKEVEDCAFQLWDAKRGPRRYLIGSADGITRPVASPVL